MICEMSSGKISRTEWIMRNEAYGIDDVLTCSGSVVDQCLPNVDGRLANHIDGVLPGEVKGCEDTIATLLAKYFDKGFARSFGHSGVFRFLVFLDLRFAADTGDLEQELSNEGDGGLLNMII